MKRRTFLGTIAAGALAGPGVLLADTVPKGLKRVSGTPEWRICVVGPVKEGDWLTLDGYTDDDDTKLVRMDDLSKKEPWAFVTKVEENAVWCWCPEALMDVVLPLKKETVYLPMRYQKFDC